MDSEEGIIIYMHAENVRTGEDDDDLESDSHKQCMLKVYM